MLIKAVQTCKSDKSIEPGSIKLQLNEVLLTHDESAAAFLISSKVLKKENASKRPGWYL